MLYEFTQYIYVIKAVKCHYPERRVVCKKTLHSCFGHESFIKDMNSFQIAYIFVDRIEGFFTTNDVINYSLALCFHSNLLEVVGSFLVGCSFMTLFVYFLNCFVIMYDITIFLVRLS